MIWQEFLKKYHVRSRKDFQYYDTQHQAQGILGAVDFTWGLVAVEIDDTERHDYISVYDLLDPLDTPFGFAIRCEATDEVSFDAVDFQVNAEGSYMITVMSEVPEYTPPAFEDEKIRNGLLISFETLWGKRYDAQNPLPTKGKICLKFSCKGSDLIGKDLPKYTYGDFLSLAGRL